MRFHRCQSPGSAFGQAFTLVEVLIVLVIVAILSSVLVPVLADSSASRLRGSAILLAQDIQYVQAEAMNTNQRLRMRFTSDTRYQVEDPDGGVGGGTQVLRHPQSDYPAHSGQFIVDFADPGPLRGTTIRSAAFAGQPWLEFGTYGEPTAAGQILLGSGRHQVRIQVAPVTGMVTVSDLEAIP